jgi:hypothetical protein
MVNRALIRTLENDPDIESMFELAVADFEEAGLFPEHGMGGGDFDVNKRRRRRHRHRHRKIKGGLLVDIGVNVFLPASQVDIRRPPTSATTSAAPSSASCSRSTKPAATSSSAAAS